MQYCSSIKAKLLPKCRCLLSAKIQYFLRPKFHKRVKPKHLGSNFIDLWVENEARKCRSYIPAMATRITSIVCLGRKVVHKMTRIPQIWKCHYLQQWRVSSHKILPFRLVNFSILVNVGFKKRLSNFGVNKHENTGEQTPFGEQSEREACLAEPQHATRCTLSSIISMVSLASFISDSQRSAINICFTCENHICMKTLQLISMIIYKWKLIPLS